MYLMNLHVLCFCVSPSLRPIRCCPSLKRTQKWISESCGAPLRARHGILLASDPLKKDGAGSCTQAKAFSATSWKKGVTMWLFPLRVIKTGACDRLTTLSLARCTHGFWETCAGSSTHISTLGSCAHPGGLRPACPGAREGHIVCMATLPAYARGRATRRPCTCAPLSRLWWKQRGSLPLKIQLVLICGKLVGCRKCVNSQKPIS